MTVVANAVSYLLSAVGIRAIGGREARPAPAEARPRLRVRDLAAGWRYIVADSALRPLFANTVLVNGLIMAASPLLAVLMVRDLGFTPWQYGLAFAVPCVGGLITCMGVFNPVFLLPRHDHPPRRPETGVRRQAAAATSR